MQKEGKATFLKFHSGSVRGVAFSPADRYLFCSGASDGRVNLYSALKTELLMCYQVGTGSHQSRVVSGVKFNSDGSKILATTGTRRLAVIDVSRGDQLISYDNCAYVSSKRTGIAADPICPNLAVCVCVNGKGMTLFDLRMPLPLDFLYDMHGNLISDCQFLHKSWPWVNGHQNAVLSVSVDGVCKISTLDGRVLHCVEAGHSVNTICVTPETYNSASEYGFPSLLLLAGEVISSYMPNVGIQEKLKEPKQPRRKTMSEVWKLRYTSNGSQLFSVSTDGVLRRYRRHPDRHQFLNDVFYHKNEIHDMDISPYDEYIITASKDSSVGILCLGSPNHGMTEYFDVI
ncbi:hypothetical protein CHUAL_013571 [Chamberlinius hualienensis]